MLFEAGVPDSANDRNQSRVDLGLHPCIKVEPGNDGTEEGFDRFDDKSR